MLCLFLNGQIFVRRKCFLAQGNLLNGILILLMCLCKFIIIIIFYLLLFFAFIIYISSLFQLVRSKASSQGKHLQTHSSTVVLSLQVQSLQCRVFNKSGQPAKFASYFMSTLHLLFFGNYPSPKSQNLILSLFYSNTLRVLLRNAVNALLEAQISKFFHPLASRAFGTRKVRAYFLFCLLQSFATYLKPYWKPCNELLLHRVYRKTNWGYSISRSLVYCKIFLKFMCIKSWSEDNIFIHHSGLSLRFQVAG